MCKLMHKTWVGSPMSGTAHQKKFHRGTASPLVTPLLCLVQHIACGASRGKNITHAQHNIDFPYAVVLDKMLD